MKASYLDSYTTTLINFCSFLYLDDETSEIPFDLLACREEIQRKFLLKRENTDEIQIYRIGKVSSFNYLNPRSHGFR